ncbi:hypothetical protein RJT34_22960 [Clitoria ternatea]|uniref:Uncharacterized protein n=1 Tax=Clitoria ternatea TaxID=43366 RepID=A0AAN9FKT1_CLITE
MACLVSLTFTVPPRASPMLSPNNKGLYRLDLALDRVPLGATIRTARKILGSCSSNKNILSVKGCCLCCLMSSRRFLHETYSYNLDVDYSTEIIISGFWVGPDEDDGWGFVEAVIEQIH